MPRCQRCSSAERNSAINAAGSPNRCSGVTSHTLHAAPGACLERSTGPGAFDRGRHLLPGDGLGHDVGDPGVETRADAFSRGVGRHRDDRRFGIGKAGEDSPGDLRAGNVGKLPVGGDQIVAVLQRPRDGCFAIRRLVDRVAELAENMAENQAVVRLVLDHKRAKRLRRGPALFRGGDRPGPGGGAQGNAQRELRHAFFHCARSDRPASPARSAGSPPGQDPRPVVLSLPPPNPGWKASKSNGISPGGIVGPVLRTETVRRGLPG